ncbi:hypothetical protein CPB84DRAFT_1783116 [Gymnopilus junonius]|uniref:Uncharacterized protein n=1 Tax=Gymnopilus junonius TaxID=109634 RepID=A0A9P5NKM5_GYMJU|nr:hypothetical protein CPB84DRAFT_1783116 [Gymnopilus junonius]
MLSDTVAVQHPPAMKVGGRRLSISAKHKAPHPAGPTKTENEGSTPADYPRPAPPLGTADNNEAESTNEAPNPNAVVNNNHEDEIPPPPKKERVDKKIEEFAHRKTEMTMPTRDMHAASRAGGQNMRIGQPAGRGFGL